MVDGLDLDEQIDAVVQLGLEGSVSLGDLTDVLGFSGGGEVPDRAQIERLVRELLSCGLVEVGDVYSRGYFVPFDGDDESALAWFMAAHGLAGTAGDLLAWLENTERGAERARSRSEARYLAEGRVVDGPVTVTGTWRRERKEHG